MPIVGLRGDMAEDSTRLNQPLDDPERAR